MNKKQVRTKMKQNKKTSHSKNAIKTIQKELKRSLSNSRSVGSSYKLSIGRKPKEWFQKIYRATIKKEKIKWSLFRLMF